MLCLPFPCHTPADTWTSDGAQHWKLCSVCGEIAGAKEHHNWTECTEETATCTAAGSQTRSCTVCGKEDTKVTEPTGHDWADPVFVWTPAESGYTVTASRTCRTVAAHVENATNVSVNSVITVPATSAAPGEIKYTATAYFGADSWQEEKTDEIPQLEANLVFVRFEWNETNTAAVAVLKDTNNHDAISRVDATMSQAEHLATCTEDAYTVYTATYGEHSENKTVTQTGTATGHTYAEPAEADWSWEKSGDTYVASVTLTCEKNDKTGTFPADVSKTAETPAGHLTDGSRTFTATVTVGAQTFTATKTDTLPAEGHSMTFVPAEAAADCTHTGTVAHYHCGVCGLDFADEAGETQLTDLDDHTCGAHAYGAWIGQTDAKCETAGELAHYHCAVCGTNFDEAYAEIDDIVIPAIGHHTLEHIPAKEAGCPNAAHAGAVTVTGNDGNIEYWSCTVCGRNFADADASRELTAAEILIPAAHRYHHVDAHAATYDANGNRAYYYCEICGEYFWHESASSVITDHNDVIIPKLVKPEEEDPTDPGNNGGNSVTRISIWELILRFFRKLFGAFRKIC